jgi:hypothetical protein
MGGRATAKLRGLQLFFATSVVAALGLVMVLLKNLILVHLAALSDAGPRSEASPGQAAIRLKRDR